MIQEDDLRKLLLDGSATWKGHRENIFEDGTWLQVDAFETELDGKRIHVREKTDPARGTVNWDMTEDGIGIDIAEAFPVAAHGIVKDRRTREVERQKRIFAVRVGVYVNSPGRLQKLNWQRALNRNLVIYSSYQDGIQIQCVRKGADAPQFFCHIMQDTWGEELICSFGGDKARSCYHNADAKFCEDLKTL